jgi:S1-C subfamily serine protease
VLVTIAALVVVAAVAVAWWAWPSSDGATDGGVDHAEQAAIATAVSTALADAAGGALTVAQVHDRVAPSLVVVEVRRPAGASAPSDTPDPSDATGGLGTGVIVNADGTILTALHVVDGATSIELTFADGTTTTATVASSAPDQDMATLRPATAPSIVVPAVLGSAGSLHVGDTAIAVGHPLGLVGSTTAGVISGLDRRMPVGDTGRELQGLIQFDAAVNPGSSGGPLLDDHGEVVGIVTALVNPEGERAFSGIGFAVPIAAALGGGAGGGPGGGGPQR